MIFYEFIIHKKLNMDYISDQQKDIVTSNYRYKLINGCAGSRKTDTLIKCAINDLNINKRPILFLTLVGTVTDEIKTRLEKELHINIDKQRSSNHYLGYYKQVPICISNYDAWVHLMLEDMVGLDDIGTSYSEKVNKLLDKTTSETLICYMKNKIKVGLLLIDEVQDLQSSKMKIITNLSLTNKDLDIYCAGDYLQTLFFDNSSGLESLNFHSMNIFKRIDPKYFDLNICRRCPKAHVDFNNLILEDIQKKYFIPPMETDNYNTIDKPVLFTHYKTSDNTNSMIIAEQVTAMIKTLLNKDNSIRPDDIVIIMGKSSKNDVYAKLQDSLNNLYVSLGYKDSVLHMSTDGDGIHNSLDWNKAKGKTKMLSIHGDKGRGHKVVFFLGLTEGSIPIAKHIDNPSEIISESLLNVGLTRSIKYLFIGFTFPFPSRYLCRIKDKLLNDIVYCSWDKDNTEEVPEPYKSIIISQNETINQTLIPNWKCIYNNEKILTGIKSMLEVKADISKDFEQTKNIIMHPWKKKETQITFGNYQKIDMPLQEDYNQLIGLMIELLIQRIANKEKLFNILKKSNNQTNIYTDDEMFLHCMNDINRNYDESNLDEYLTRFKSYFSNKPELIQNIKNAVTQNKIVLHSIFKTVDFQKDLQSFLSETNNKDLKTQSIWNVTLFYNQITQYIYRPVINSFLDHFNQDISILHDNIDIYINNYTITNNVDFEKRVNLKGTLTEEDIKILKKNRTENRTVSIAGRCDIYDPIKKNLYEIKASRIQGCSQEWLTQTVLYAMMLDVYNLPIKQIYIVNLLNGNLWKWEWEWEFETLPKIEDIVSNKISKKYEWHKLETRAIIKGIEKERSKHIKT